MEAPKEGHPIVMGLLALVGVGLAVGLLISGAALAGTSVLGLHGDASDSKASSRQSLHLPKPSLTKAPGPGITLRPNPTSSASGHHYRPPKPKSPITLASSEVQVPPMGRIDLTGTYPTGEGAIVQVQRLVNGQWTDFATVDAVVSNQTFSTYIQTGQVGMNIFRVRDTDTSAVSNAVRVRVG